MWQLGFDLQSKDEFVWMGPNIDAEQLSLETAISRAGLQTDIDLINLLFETSKPEVYLQQNNRLYLDQPPIHPLLRIVMEAIGTDHHPYQTNEEVRSYIDQLLATLHRCTGVREGWYVLLEGILKGESTPPRTIDMFDLNDALGFALVYYAQPSIDATPMVVLEVDMAQLVSLLPIYFFPISDRPPHTIVPAIRLPREAVASVYTESELELPFDGPIKPFSSLDQRVWLKDETGLPITPEAMMKRSSDPRKTLCALRYDMDPYKIWVEQFFAGNFAQFGSGPQYLPTPTTKADHFLRQVMLQKAEEHNLLELLRQHGYPTPEKSYFSIRRSIKLPSVIDYID